MNLQKKIEITPEEMISDFKKNGRDQYFLVDIRSYNERIIDGFIEDDLFLPMEILLENQDKIPHDKIIIFYCRSGVRSLYLTNIFQENYNFKEVLNLKGGIIEYKKKF
jgi:adenylyltransferase/sulfurtransferase